MDKTKLSYNAKTTTLRYASGISGKELFAKDDAKTLSEIGRNGSHDGQPVSAVEVLFDDQVAAEYNASALEFLRLVAATSAGPVASGAQFRARKDFGLE
jgi:hypothetical protein